jgi:outer membrane protein with beta-barrel domain
MEQQSDNNLDALFQKAAEEYPLKINNRNWDIVAAKLHTSSTGIQTKKSKKWQYAILLLLLLGGSFFIVDSLNKKQAISYAVKQSSLSQKNKSNNKQQKTYKNQPSRTLSKNNNVIQIIGISKPYVHSANEGIYSKDKAFVSSELLNKDNDSLAQIHPSMQPKPFADNSNNNFIALSQLKNDISSITNKNIIQNPDKTDKAVNANKNIKHINLRPQPKTFYGTFFLSPNFATIKFQHINKPGYSIGVGLGYRINKRISAEVGLQRVHANFYSDAKYVDTSNLKLKRPETLDALNGNNKLTEVPVVLKYNLFKNNYHFFATAGTTVALIMHAEKYDYNIIKNNRSPRDVYRKFSALTATKFFSSVNLSVGYETSVSKFFNVKIEPYFQAATQGLGIGNLPVNNFGVNIGIIKDLK